MENQPKKLIVRIMEAAVLFALSAFLIRLGVCYILEIWPVLLIIAAVTVGIVVGYRIWKNKVKW
jgi:hypothetical protein